PLHPDVVLESLAAESSHPDFAAAVRPTPEGPSRYAVVVTPSPKLRRGVSTGTITLKPVAVGGKPLPTITLPVVVEVTPDVEAVPGRVLFPARDVGSEQGETVTLHSLSNRPFVLEQVAAEGPGVTAVPARDGRGVNVGLMIPSVGPLGGSVRVTV